MTVAVGLLTDVSLTKAFRLTEPHNEAGDQTVRSPLPTNWRDYLPAMKLSITSPSFPSGSERNTIMLSCIHCCGLCYIHLLRAVLYTHCVTGLVNMPGMPELTFHVILPGFSLPVLL